MLADGGAACVVIDRMAHAEISSTYKKDGKHRLTRSSRPKCKLSPPSNKTSNNTLRVDVRIWI